MRTNSGSRLRRETQRAPPVQRKTARRKRPLIRYPLLQLPRQHPPHKGEAENVATGLYSFRKQREAYHMFMYLLLLPILIGFPMGGLAQFTDKGDKVEVEKGIKLCSNIAMEMAKGSLDPRRVSWRVRSEERRVGKETVAAFVHEK